jgi:hypothetical protein
MGFKEIYTDDELIDILVDRAGELGRTPTVTDMKSFGAPYASLYQRRFATHKGLNDGWNNALLKAGLKTNRKLPDQDKECCSECGCDGNTENGKLIRWMGTSKVLCIKHYQQMHYKHRNKEIA